MKAILFDFDGVVIKSMESHYQGWQKAMKEYGIDMSPEELYILEGQGVEEVASQLVRKFNLPSDERNNIIEKKRLYYDQVKKDELYPNFLDVLEWAKEKKVRPGFKNINVSHDDPQEKNPLECKTWVGIPIKGDAKSDDEIKIIESET